MTPTPTRRRKNNLPTILAAIAAVSILFIGAAIIAWQIGWVKGGTTPAAATSPTLAHLSERATCILLIPTLTDAQAEIKALTDKPDGSTINFDRVETLIAHLATLERNAPAHMRDDIAAQAQPLKDIQAVKQGTSLNQTLHLGARNDAGFRLLTRCAEYAS